MVSVAEMAEHASRCRSPTAISAKRAGCFRKLFGRVIFGGIFPKHPADVASLASILF
jgi:hypothetical protein